ncbi:MULTISPECIES: SDR family NAD(P)-dependent oxidoreductase [Pseudonocardia]|uniref:3-oxoacyl-[acyl-carrier-protein] reductase FabG n=2 Tax=Pseudonocardia TaxID=1847 RepID=A0A1Y2MY24_PSEAH|nr:MULTISPECIES: SDR family NAD(P)-dependent oxidoreductase [Pseudonocardia]OSY40062.1 3-oxoacyl-[acyl-carrier-protein] reductase FabG [Pseudonocardia autotrophica]TDN72992.1 3-oxoacyl-[acyl-carrier protein] reductase [Pseudonocardia autotrophica]BBG03712.1 beta-ketoacyl-ACP reductase [Pseudonocardia autotrophica]GEC28401.1 beta-ketoacyl-ACP reductase [Pseudonocardia saturnea]
MSRLQNVSVLVSGGGRGIGRAGAIAMAAEGATVGVLDLDAGAAEAVADEIGRAGGTARAWKVDVVDPDQVAAVVEEAVQWAGGVDVFVHSAGIVAPAMLKDMTLESFENVVRVNLTGTFVCLTALIPHWTGRGRGKFVALASPAAVRGQVGGGNYAAAKAGVVALVKTAAAELARYNVTANALLPIAATEMSANVRENPKLEEKFLGMIPLRRWATPEDIAPSLVYLASSDSDYMTGSVLSVDGGRTI